LSVRQTRLGKGVLADISKYDLERWGPFISNTAQKKVRRNHGNRLAKRAVSPTIADEPPRKGGILAALRRSPLIGADLDLTRSREINRKARAQ
jgi:hypothetical protein